VSIKRTPGYGELNPVTHIRGILATVPDTPVPASTEEMDYVADEAYRRVLRSDLASIEEMVRTQQWKGAMVLAGSLMEALLLDQLLDNVGLAQAQAIGLEVGIKVSDLTRWHLTAYARVGHASGLIKESTRDQVLLGQDFRNLVHPGKSIRERASCSRGSAMSTVGALFLLMDDLKARKGTPAAAGKP
jgi:hypothetical protein